MKRSSTDAGKGTGRSAGKGTGKSAGKGAGVSSSKGLGRSAGKGTGSAGRRIGCIFSFAAVIVWMVFIFYLSAQVAEQSNQLSTGITATIMRIIRMIIPNAELDLNSFNHFVRKNAHFIAYLVLGLLSSNALGKRKLIFYKSSLFALLICVLYAISDEVHQLFVPGRGGQAADVLIDSAGALVGIVLHFILMKLRHRAINT